MLDCYRAAENSHSAKHVVAAGNSVRDAGSTPAASTTFFKLWGQLGRSVTTDYTNYTDRPESSRLYLCSWMCSEVDDPCSPEW